MNLNDLKQLIIDMNPGRDIKMEFDANCYRKVEFTFDNGASSVLNQVEFNKVKVNIDGNITYVTIQPHRVNVPLKESKSFIASIQDVFIPHNTLKTLNECYRKVNEDCCPDKSNSSHEKQELENAIKQFMEFTGKDREYILQKIAEFNGGNKQNENT